MTLTRAQTQVSRRISLVLRHRPETAGLVLDRNGWVPVAELLAALTISRDDLQLIVDGNDKQRFAIGLGPDGAERIRASQGHSRRVEVDLDLPAAEPPAVLFHGTARENLDSIRAAGLRPQSRHHVHLSPDLQTAAKVGRRHSADVVLLRVAAGEMAAEGRVFHRSDNGVWLTTVVPANFLSEETG